MTWAFTELEFGKSDQSYPRRESGVFRGEPWRRWEKKALSSGSEDRSHWAEEAVGEIDKAACQAFLACLPGESGQVVSKHIGNRAKLQLQPCTFTSRELLAEWWSEQHLDEEGPLLSRRRTGQLWGRLAPPLPGGRRGPKRSWAWRSPCTCDSKPAFYLRRENVGGTLERAWSQSHHFAALLVHFAEVCILSTMFKKKKRMSVLYFKVLL